MNDAELLMKNVTGGNVVVHDRLTARNIDVENLRFVLENNNYNLQIGSNNIITASSSSSSSSTTIESVEPPLTGDGSITDPLAFDTTGAVNGEVLTFSNSAWTSQALQLSQGVSPNATNDNYNETNLTTYLTSQTTTQPTSSTDNDVNISRFYTHGATATTSAYAGGVYDPVKNRIYFVPYNQAPQANWHYIDCDTGVVTAYAHGVGALPSGAFLGGIYSPNQRRIYLTPHILAEQPATNTDWFYIDCETGVVTAYAHGRPSGEFGVGFHRYSGGCYSPTQDRIYFAPYGWDEDPVKWHFIDCSDGSVQAYTHGLVSPFLHSFYTGVYSPTENRVYLIQWQTNVAARDQFMFIDCSDGSVNVYQSTQFISQQMYSGAVYAPLLNRIYLVPENASSFDTWHYIDCNNNGNVVGYTSIPTVASGQYFGGGYDPTTHRVYFSRVGGVTPSVMHYIDGIDGTLHTFTTNLPSPSGGDFIGAVFSPTESRLYFVPLDRGPAATWEYIQGNPAIKVSRSLMSGPLFNKL